MEPAAKIMVIESMQFQDQTPKISQILKVPNLILCLYDVEESLDLERVNR